jgi:hypothetical protein
LAVLLARSPDQVARALVWMTERYLLETYGRGAGIPAQVAAETLAELWHRAVFDAATRPGEAAVELNSP